MLAERKQTILRSIEAQGKLTEKLAKQIFSAGTTKRLEDLYLPFKPKKQTLATTARSRGLEPLAREILDADPLAADLDTRAADFVNPDRHVPTAADALLGAGHILAEQFSERADLRQRLREILQRSGKVITSQIVSQAAAAAEKPPAPTAPAPTAPVPATPAQGPASAPGSAMGEESAKAEPSAAADESAVPVATASPEQKSPPCQQAVTPRKQAAAPRKQALVPRKAGPSSRPVPLLRRKQWSPTCKQACAAQERRDQEPPAPSDEDDDRPPRITGVACRSNRPPEDELEPGAAHNPAEAPAPGPASQAPGRPMP